MSYASSRRRKSAQAERRAEDKRLADIERSRRKRRARVRKVSLIAGSTVAVIAVGTMAIVKVQADARQAGTGPANMASDGIVLSGDGTTVTAVRSAAIGPGESNVPTVSDDLTTGVLDITVYLDYRDPEAAAFWTANGASIESYLTAGYVTLEIHPLALLDDGVAITAAVSDTATASSSSDTTLLTVGDYSARAAGAMACVADSAPDSALFANDALITAQTTLPAEGLTDDELISALAAGGLSDDAVSDCITSGDFTDWAAEATERAASSVPADVGSVTTSPVIVVGGQAYPGDLGDADAFLSFLDEVAAS